MDAARSWHTQLSSSFTGRYGCDGLHAAVFEHRDDPGGSWRCIGIELPETPRQRFNAALRMARRSKARILIIADSAEQVHQAVTRIERRCPHHRRVSLERANGGGFGRTM